MTFRNGLASFLRPGDRIHVLVSSEHAASNYRK